MNENSGCFLLEMSNCKSNIIIERKKENYHLMKDNQLKQHKVAIVDEVRLQDRFLIEMDML